MPVGPLCNARRMAETAARLVDHVFPPRPARQWVLSVPKRVRRYLEREPRAISDVPHIFLLAPICDWFTEGFDTQDLQDAKALLEALT